MKYPSIQPQSIELPGFPVDVLAKQGHAIWRVRQGKEQFSYQTLYQMVTRLRAWTTQPIIEGETP